MRARQKAIAAAAMFARVVSKNEHLILHFHTLLENRVVLFDLKPDKIVCVDRRKFLLQTAGILAVNGLAKPVWALTGRGAAGGTLSNEAQNIAYIHNPPRGAIYIPAQSYNAYQAWRNYDPNITRRDIGYAHSLRLNALRVWLSYEFWRHDHQALRQRFTDLLSVCSANGIKVMPVLFEGDGVEPTPVNLVNTHPLTASDVLSPSTHIVRYPKLWHEPQEFVEWFMHHFRNDRRLLAIEINNEPWGKARHAFAHAMTAHAAKIRGSVPLSIGSVDLNQGASYVDAGADILQIHLDFPPSATAVRRVIRGLMVAQKHHHRPVWMTEWQRLRPSGQGWGNKPLRGNEWEPDYASMAPIIRAYPIGNFFWSLMLKPAWLLAQRRKGTLNGVFHEDGSVWSLSDARAISGNPHFQATERKAWPHWAEMIPQSLGMPH
jgi:hypothetical protein